MEILTTFVTAEEDEFAAIGESPQPLDEWSGLERRDIDTSKIAILHSLLTGEELEQAFYLYEPVYASVDEVMVLRLADDMVGKLASLDEDALESVAEELAATEAFEREQWDADEALDFVLALAELAQLAHSQDQVLFARTHPLLA